MWKVECLGLVDLAEEKELADLADLAEEKELS